MIRNVDPKSDHFLDALRALDSRLARVQREISSGKRIERPSDAPEDVIDVLRLKSGLQHNDQVLTDLTRSKAEVDTGESALQYAIKLLDQVRVLGAQGTGTVTAATRSTLAQQVKQLQEQLVHISQTRVEGRYIFSGDADATAAYSFNTGSPTGVDRLFAMQSTRMVVDTAGNLFSVRRTAEQIFDSRNPDSTLAEGNLFAAVNSLRLGLEGDSTATIETAMQSIVSAGDHLNAELAHYGAAQNRISRAIDAGEKMKVQASDQLSRRLDTDMPAAIVELTQLQTQRDTALSAQSKSRITSLFDFLR